MKIRNQNPQGDKIELQMTPMIDIVFQLLVFFIMTFRIANMEGDFHIRMPSAAPRTSLVAPDPDTPLPITIHMRDADQDGNLDPGSFAMDQQGLASMSDLTARIFQRVYPGGQISESFQKDAPEVILDCDSTLRYEFVMAAITAVSGEKRKSPGGDEIVIRLAEKIRFKDNSAGS
ncbi:ExbD/TolR family protein [Lignipirellula cremea]|uniref:Biopolymer transport protein ExbD/TolR n=1 Tax=Lignipirellula cremea TaxID=2528010 RepID=A0A518E278_9BACT|nr:biopolymer transporter ExbD [Lignipirellula cremea]QDU98191.1 Biopolymer transport protein ExbD/TolR [Lignipirellula cremea]